MIGEIAGKQMAFTSWTPTGQLKSACLKGRRRNFSQGQRVLLTGKKSTMIDGQPNVAGADFAKPRTAGGRLILPQSLWKEIMPPSGEWQWVEVERTGSFFFAGSGSLDI